MASVRAVIRSRIGRLAAALGSTVAIVSAPARAQPVAADVPPSSPPAATGVTSSTASAADRRDEALNGIWPSKKLMALALVRMADRVANRYELDEEQTQRFRDLTVERWTRFAEEHRRPLQPLLNEFLEMRMGLEPPPPERVKDWADRAMPMFERYRVEFQAATLEFREVLDPIKRAKFEIDAMQYRVGMEFVESKLERWQQGQFLEDDLWEGPPGRDRRGRDDGEAAGGNRGDQGRPDAALTEAGVPVEPKGPEDQIAVELGLWDEYVARFIQNYRLDDAQRDAVLSCLAELKQRAVAHRDSHWHEIVALERKIADSTNSEADLADIKAKLVDLYGPIDMMFQELMDRLEHIPTGPQRAAAAERQEESGSPKGGPRAEEAKPRGPWPKRSGSDRVSD